MTTLNVYSQESNIEILQNTITNLNNIESVFYTSRFEGNESEVTYIHSEDSIFFLFDNFNKSSTPKYRIKNVDSELIFDGKNHIQSMVIEKVILTGGSRNPNNPLLLTLFPIRELLPQLINNENVLIERKDDITFNGQKNYVFDVLLKNSVIDWEQLKINTFDKADVNFNTYTIIINKSNYLPSKIIMPNGPTGSMSRTIENLNFNYQIDDRTWTGDLLPKNYTRITLQDYFKRMQENMTLQSKESQTNSEKQKLDDWKIPDLATDKLVDFSQFRGKVVLLEFWFKYCGPCVKAVPELNELSKKYKKDEFLLYGVEFRENFPKADLQKYVSKIKIDYPVLYKGKELASKYSVQAAPTFMIIDKEGKIVYLESGFDKERIETIIKESL
ncbi:MAG: TlpA family protein disulfide reductase [Winogradskyella sp.]|uniref:TlpA family protein disulfide reductase n=1 Tax=Winogradskyella sp. TaxID=1883156 RepID=UPI0025E8445E|nr:TlpA disulfide reductase family protein [Winogradskyella sp.]NRB84901.1 TlpA family protein disulfide reductase [Winogradskyella sp.]